MVKWEVLSTMTTTIIPIHDNHSFSQLWKSLAYKRQLLCILRLKYQYSATSVLIEFRWV